MEHVSQKSGIKKRIYVLTFVSIATLAFLTVLFFKFLLQERELLSTIKSQQFAKVSTLSNQFANLSNNHVRLVDLLTSSSTELSDETVKSVGVRILNNLNNVFSELQQSRTLYGRLQVDSASYRRLIQHLQAYRNSATAAVRLASTDLSAATSRLRTANRNFRRISAEYETLIQSARRLTDSFITAALRSHNAQGSMFMAGIIVITVLLTILSLIMVRAALRDLTGIADSMRALVEGKQDVEIPGLERRDEVGDMARAIAVFQVSHQQIDVLAQLEEKEIALETEIEGLRTQKGGLEDKLNALSASAEGLEVSRDEAWAENQAKAGLMGTISYDIRTPMNGLIGMAGLMAETELTDRQREYVIGIRKSGEALLGVVDDLIDYSRLEAGHTELQPAGFDILDVIDDLPNLIDLNDEQIVPDILFYIAQDVPQFVKGDEKFLSRALSGVIKTVLRSSDTDQISLELSVKDHQKDSALICFDVIDHPDMSNGDAVNATLDRAWAQEELTPNRLAKFGLSLAVAKRFATLMGGTLEFHRETGGASRWRLTAKLGVVERVGDDWLAPMSGLIDRKALIVNANPVDRETLCRQLENWGITAEHASDGRSALARLARAVTADSRFDMVFIDQDLADMSGAAFLRAVHAAYASGGISILLFHRPGETPDFDQEAKGMRLSAIMERPVTPRRLFDTLVSVFGGDESRTVLDEADFEDEEATSMIDADGASLRVLLVDDNTMNQKVVSAMLASTHHYVDVATNGLEALDALKKAEYDVILMDIQMPEMDGVTATKEIRAMSGDIANIPIIALTANAMEGDREKYLAAGMNDYISKPIDRNTLLETVQAHAPGQTRTRAQTLRATATGEASQATDGEDGPETDSIPEKDSDAATGT